MGKIEVLYEDNHVISVVKPTGILSQGDLSGDVDMLTMIKDYIKVKYDKPGNVFLGLVHRLDRPTGGAMVFAKTSKGASRLCDSIRTGDFKKQYLTVLKGELSGSGTLEDYLFKDQRNNMSSICDKNRKGAKKAILNYEVLDSKDGLSLVKVDLITGRHHQIRVQFANLGYPLFGERKYSKYTGRGDLALWAYRIVFPHPTKKTPIEVIADLPDIYPYNLFEY